MTSIDGALLAIQDNDEPQYVPDMDIDSVIIRQNEKKYDSALIAAAPEMLEWLEWVNVAIRPLVDNCYKSSEFRNCELCLLEPCNFKKIEMLIAKAKGETNGDT